MARQLTTKDVVRCLDTALELLGVACEIEDPLIAEEWGQQNWFSLGGGRPPYFKRGMTKEGKAVIRIRRADGCVFEVQVTLID